MPSLEDLIVDTPANLRSVRADYDEAVFTYLGQVPHHMAA